jgi:hypothetical protein
MASDPPRTAGVWTLLVLLVVQGIGAVGGGIALVAAPDGGILHMPVENLHGSPFHDFLIPGIVLLVVLGVWPLAAAAGLWRHRAWAWYSAFAIGCGLMVFEVVEVLSIPFSPLQPIYFLVGLALAGLALLPSVRRFAGLRPLGS